MFESNIPRITRDLLLLTAAILLAVPIPAAPGGSPAPSDLLQKAIYAEETVGNLDEAIKLYEQVVADGKAARSAAAQAQYRLGLCYEKQGKAEEAKKAFQTVVDDYAGETDVAAQAAKHLPGKIALEPAPWKSGEQLQLNMKLPGGMDVGTMIYMVDAVKHDGQDVTQCSTRGLVTVNGAASFSKVLCNAETFAPISSYWMHTLLGTAEATYASDSVSITMKGRDKASTIDFKPPVFDNEQAAQLFRRLPLEVGYKTTIPIIPTLTGTKINLGVEVTAKEKLEVPAGTFEAYKLALNIGQTFWISADEHRYIVKFAAGGVEAQLAEIGGRSDEPKKIDDDVFALTLPADWHIYVTGKSSGKDEKIAFLLDPDGTVTATLTVGEKASLKEAEQASPKAWTESHVGSMKKALADFAVRAPGVEEKTIGGLPAAVIIADQSSDGKKETSYGVAVLSATRGATLRLTVPSDKFDEYRPTFEKIADSLQVK